MKRIALSLLLVLLVSGMVLAQAEIVVIRSAITASSPSYPTYTGDMNAFLNFMNAHYNYDVITDEEVVAGKLNGYKLAIMNSQGVVTEDEIDAIWDFVDGGGKLFATFSTAFRMPGVDGVRFNLGDLFGLSWKSFQSDPEFTYFLFVENHPIFKGLGDKLPVGSKAFQNMNVDFAEVLGVRADADEFYKDEFQDGVIFLSDAGVYVAYPLLASANIVQHGPSTLTKAIIDYYAPGARR